MGSDEFSDLIEEVRNESFSEEKLQIIEEAAADAWFRTSQIRRLVAALDFRKGRVKAAIFLYDRCVDQEDYESVLAALEFAASKREVRRELDL